MRVKCNACGAIYDEWLPDGSQYFHACPPLSASELDTALKAGKVTLPAGETPIDAVTRRSYERGNKRDENTPSSRAADAAAMKSSGAGVTVIGPTPPSKVIVP